MGTCCRKKPIQYEQQKVLEKSEKAESIIDEKKVHLITPIIEKKHDSKVKESKPLQNKITTPFHKEESITVKSPEIFNDYEIKINNIEHEDDYIPTKQVYKSIIGQKESFFSSKINLESFDIIKTIGKGTFGKVYLARYKKDQKMYAMKILRKDTIKEFDQVNNTKSEREILERMIHPFIVRLQFAFQSNERLYLVTDFMQSGELFYHLRNETRFSEEKARFYCSQIILALEFLHKNKIIYRDLKPENILLDREGNIRLTDFGLSKITYGEQNRAFTICGTPEYLAPEILLEKGYDKSVDWWSLGVLLYEMLSGFSPFKLKKDVKVDYKNYMKHIDYPYYFSYEATSLIEGLLKVNCEERLGYGERDSELIKKHEFFKGLNWDHVIEKKIKVPYKPVLNFDDDLKYFDQRLIAEVPESSITISEDDEDLQKSQDEPIYERFTYIHSISNSSYKEENSNQEKY